MTTLSACGVANEMRSGALRLFAQWVKEKSTVDARTAN